MKWANGNGVVATADERNAIVATMSLFHGIRYQIGGANPSGGCYRIRDDDVVVWTDLAFFVLYKIGGAANPAGIYLEPATQMRAMRLASGRNAVFFPNI